jgi:hypothetical protein
VKHDAFMPPDDLEFSVTRLRGATSEEVWTVGEQVAVESSRSLHGRADIEVRAFGDRQLQTIKDKLPNNPNHAKVIGWSRDKPGQMIIAKELAATPGLRRIAPPPVPDNPAHLPASSEAAVETADNPKLAKTLVTEMPSRRNKFVAAVRRLFRWR